jgi:hypothetical protein
VASESLYHLKGGPKSGLHPMNVQHEGTQHWFLKSDAGGTLIGVDQANGGNTTYDENGDPISSGFGTLGVTGIGLAAGSAVPLAIGIPLWVVGARGEAVPVAGVPRPNFAVITRSGVQTKTATLSWSF